MFSLIRRHFWQALLSIRLFNLCSIYVSKFIIKLIFGFYFQATIRKDAEYNYCVYESDIATGLGVGSFLFLLASQLLIMLASRCLCCVRPLLPGKSRAWTVVLFITCWFVYFFLVDLIPSLILCPLLWEIFCSKIISKYTAFFSRQKFPTSILVIRTNQSRDYPSPCLPWWYRFIFLSGGDFYFPFSNNFSIFIYF